MSGLLLNTLLHTLVRLAHLVTLMTCGVGHFVPPDQIVAG